VHFVSSVGVWLATGSVNRLDTARFAHSEGSVSVGLSPSAREVTLVRPRLLAAPAAGPSGRAAGVPQVISV